MFLLKMFNLFHLLKLIVPGQALHLQTALYIHAFFQKISSCQLFYRTQSFFVFVGFFSLRYKKRTQFHFSFFMFVLTLVIHFFPFYHRVVFTPKMELHAERTEKWYNLLAGANMKNVCISMNFIIITAYLFHYLQLKNLITRKYWSNLSANKKPVVCSEFICFGCHHLFYFFFMCN